MEFLLKPFGCAPLSVALCVFLASNVLASLPPPFADDAERDVASFTLAKYICLANQLAPQYHLLRASALPYEVLFDILQHCEATHTTVSLNAPGSFLSSFFIRNCDTWRPPSSGSSTKHLRLNELELTKLFPRWLWDANIGESFEEIMKRTDGRQQSWGVAGKEGEFAQYPEFSQGQAVNDPAFVRFKGETTGYRYNLSFALEYAPSRVQSVTWLEIEKWVNWRGYRTKFHYDYDPHPVVFQVQGSRRFRILAPASGLIKYIPEDVPMDYGTRWDGNEWRLPYNQTGRVMVLDLKPRDVLYLRNGWPHEVTYTKNSIAYTVRTYSQCEALSKQLGEQLCLLSSALGTERLCFDDARYREQLHYKSM